MMKIGMLLLLVLVSCSNIEIKNKVVEVKTQNISVAPGKVKYAGFDTTLHDGEHFLICGKKKVSITVKDLKGHIYLAESYFSKRKTYNCYLDYDQNTPLLAVTVGKFDYPHEKVNVNKKRVDLNKKDLARAIKEKAIKKKIYLSSSDSLLFSKPFKVPLNSYITSHYGNRRIFNNHKKSQHLGNDFRAKVGVPIPVANDGKVVFAGNLFFTGNVVVIDHGLGIFTVYAHLSKINVKLGDAIVQDQTVGLAGMTGRVSGPHLHWGVKVAGHWVDGFSLVNESKENFRN